MKELVTTEQATRVIVLLAIALPAVGLAAGVVVGAIRKRLAEGARLGLLCGLVGPALWVMWRVYNSIMDHYGLDSVRGLLINLALFIGVGLVIGWATRAALRRRAGLAAPR